MSVSTKEPTEDTGAAAVPEQTTEQLSTAGSARRRFAKRAGLGTTGVLLTLASQPGMATVVCKSPSRNMSVTTSVRPGEQVNCSGIGPVAWCNTSIWPCNKDTMTFGKCFPCGANSYGNNYLKSLVASTATDQLTDFARALSVTYLNVMSNRISFLTLEDLVSMFTEIQNTYQYKATSSVTWNVTQLTAYLKSTYSGS